jgi:hypothetical protein
MTTRSPASREITVPETRPGAAPTPPCLSDLQRRHALDPEEGNPATQPTRLLPEVGGLEHLTNALDH